MGQDEEHPVPRPKTFLENLREKIREDPISALGLLVAIATSSWIGGNFLATTAERFKFAPLSITGAIISLFVFSLGLTIGGLYRVAQRRSLEIAADDASERADSAERLSRQVSKALLTAFNDLDETELCNKQLKMRLAESEKDRHKYSLLLHQARAHVEVGNEAQYQATITSERAIFEARLSSMRDELALERNRADKAELALKLDRAIFSGPFRTAGLAEGEKLRSASVKREPQKSGFKRARVRETSYSERFQPVKVKA